jgi:hypothetical protein
METKLDNTSSERCRLPIITEGFAPHPRVDLKVAPISDWPDSDWYLPCEAESADFNNDLILALARSYNTLLCSLIRNSMTVWAPTKRRVRGHLDLILTNFTPSKLSELVEQQVRSFTLKWIGEHDCCLDKPPEKSVHQDPVSSWQ